MRQASSAGGDPIGECNDKRWLVIEAAGCERFAHYIEDRVWLQPVTLDCA